MEKNSFRQQGIEMKSEPLMAAHVSLANLMHNCVSVKVDIKFNNTEPNYKSTNS